MGLLEGKKVLVTGVLTDDSIAFGVAQLAQREGAEIVLTGFGRALRLTERTARKLDVEPEVLELDITEAGHVTKVREHLEQRWGRLDAAVHSIGFAPEACLGDDLFSAGWSEVSVAISPRPYSRAKAFSSGKVRSTAAPARSSSSEKGATER